MSERPICLADFQKYAEKSLSKSIYDYYRSGADDQQTLAENVAAFSRLKLYPRMLRNVSVLDLSTCVLGQRISMPICAAATAMQRMAHADGEMATARGDSKADIAIGPNLDTCRYCHCKCYHLSRAGKTSQCNKVARNVHMLVDPFTMRISDCRESVPQVALRNVLGLEDAQQSGVVYCRSMGTGMMLSSWATSSIEEVAQAAPEAVCWLQLYIYKDREVTRSLVKRAEKSGYKGIFLTVDTPFLGKRLDDVRNKFQLPPHLRMKNFETNDLAFSSKKGYGENSGLSVYVAEAIDPSINWEDIKWLRGLTSLPIIAKGILRADDAREAVKHGVNAILVSNHGARQLDGVPATVSFGETILTGSGKQAKTDATAKIDVLPEIIEAVEGKVEVFLDGGIRKGTDVLKALALGAKAVFVGRPIIWGLAYQGEEGVRQVLQILKEEFQLAMALSGCQNIEAIDRTLVRQDQRVLSKI